MSDVSPATINLLVLAVALALYSAIWYATRNMSRFAQVLARLSPIGLVIPLVLYVSALTGTLHRAPERTARPPEPAVEQVETKEAARKAPDVTSRSARPGTGSSTGSGAGSGAGTATETPTVTQPETGGAGPETAARPAEPAPESGGEPPTTGEPEAKPTEWDIVPVFFGTDRERKDQPKRIGYGSARAHRLELGRALVTVPKIHQVPKIERPFAIRVPLLQVTLLELSEDPRRHFTIRELKALTREEFVALTRERVAGSSAFKDQAVIFVHGYNNDFDFAVYRTAQMAYDLQFDGATFLYSWPSGSGLTGYNYDRESATQAEPHLRRFIDLVVRESGASSVSVIAHSMGNLPLLQVLRDLGPALPQGVQLNQVILASPDVDRDVFTYLAANLTRYSRGITLYCSANDRAMDAARRMAGGIPRAGDVPPEGPVVVEGIDTIDVSGASGDYLALNHSDYAERDALLNDIGLLLQTGERPPDRRIPILQRVDSPRGAFWRYPVMR